MSTLTAAPLLDSSRRNAMNGHAADFMCDDVRTRISLPARSRPRPRIPQDGPANDLRLASAPARADGPPSLPTRIALLIQAEGSASALARRCGFSEGAVRSWRDGRSDISRERCITLAQSLGVSLLWLVAGEGTMRAEAQPVGEIGGADADPPIPRDGGAAAPHPRAATVDSCLLACALRLLQSYIGLAGGSLDSRQRASALVELYELLQRAGEPGHAERLIAFNASLRHLLNGNRCVLIA